MTMTMIAWCIACRWSAYGTIEPSAEQAIADIASHPEWLDLSNRYFVLLGAGSAMGPIQILLAHGANIVAVDLNRPQIWERLLNMAKESCGTMTFPLPSSSTQSTAGGDDVKELAKVAGCNLFTQAPEIKNWVSAVAPGKQLVIGGYAYLDGALHVQVGGSNTHLTDAVPPV